MARLARRDVVNPIKSQILHCTQRCVRGVFLCGKDCATGKSFEHRRGWIRHRLEFLASVFGIDCLTYTVLSNHAHVVLRSRPDVVKSWSDIEVARRWLQLYPQRLQRKERDDNPDEPSEIEINRIVDDPARLAKLRLRLSDVSWWMSSLAENIARRSNAEDQCEGRFWQGRFGCQSGWLSPIEIDPSQDVIGPDLDSTGRRASHKGFLSISLTDYLQLLDWTGRSIRADKRGLIPNHLAPILSRLGLDTDRWCEVVTRFGKLFKRAAGSTEQLAEEARRRGLHWLQGPGGRLLSASST